VRKLAVIVVLAALGVTLLAPPASAAFDHHFRVIEKARYHRLASGNGFRFRGKLFAPRNRHNRVGRDHGRCRLRHNVGRCRAVVHLNGKIGGSGDLKIRGQIRTHDNRLIVIGGSHDFNGVAGKVLLHNLNRRTTALRFALVR
jgi:hypothetical protein